jgi:hypothetical protein
MTASTLIRPARSVRLRAGAILRRPCPHQEKRPQPEPRPSQVVLRVELVDALGSRWTAIGGGNTITEAVAFARASAPEGGAWKPVRWTELYGD